MMPSPLIALTPLLLSAQIGAPPVTIEEYLQLKELRAVQIAPDGGSVAFTLTEADLDANAYRTYLYVWSEEDLRRLAPRRKDVHAPRWSHDGTWLAFLSNVAADPAETTEEADPTPHPQLWIVSALYGREAIQLTTQPGGVLDFGWAPNGSIYAMGSNDSTGAAEFLRIEIPDGVATLIWSGDPGMREMAVSPDGNFIAFTSNGTGSPDDYDRYDLWALDVESGSARPLTDRRGAESAPIWSPDSRTIVFRAPQDPRIFFSQTELFSVAASGGSSRNLTEVFDRTVIEHRWPPGGELTFTAALGAYTHLFAVKENGGVEARTSGAVNYGAFDAGVVGATIYAVRESASEGAELWRVRGSQIERLTDFNARTRGWKVGRQQIVRWSAPDGLNIEGLLVYPADYESGRIYPLLVNPHEGPSSRVRNVVQGRAAYQLFAAQGYAVLAPNFRGSAGYGDQFASANRNDVGGGDFADLMSGIDHVIAMGVADPTRLAIYGADYGGYLAQWTITQTPKFRAALSMHDVHAPSVDDSDQTGHTPEALWANYLADISYELGRSPTRLAGNVNTPLLIITNAEDGAMPGSSAYDMYQALRDRGKIAQLVAYPSADGEGFGPRQQAELFFRQLRWFDKYLKFGGADLFDFYLVDEWAPGPNGWHLKVTSIDPRAEYADSTAAVGRYLEIAIALAPDEAAIADRTIRSLRLDLGSDVRLLGPDGNAIAPSGTVADLFGQQHLVPTLGTISVPLPAEGAPSSLVVNLTFDVPVETAEYLLQVSGFGPVRIWAPSIVEDDRGAR